MFAIELPPLRQRKEDLPLLVQSFLAEFNARNNKAVSALDPAAMRILEQYNWPGNVRELRNVIERAVILSSGEFIEPKHLPPLVTDSPDVVKPTLSLHAGDDGGRGRDAADPDDARAHARQQDARRRDPRHQPEDAAQQAEQAAGRAAASGTEARIAIAVTLAFHASVAMPVRECSMRLGIRVKQIAA